ncbi:hypothetical protein [Nostoc sp. C110]|uniref:hypothetical protein n=1 Tax=Nostoc sp. C110 TaxID=3349876 RepID=UPI00370D7E29
MCKFIDILKADRGERYISSYWLIPHRSLGISSSKERQQTRFLYVKTGLLTNYINNFSKTLNKYLIASNVFGCSIGYIDIASKLILGDSPSKFAFIYKIEFI